MVNIVGWDVTFERCERDVQSQWNSCHYKNLQKCHTISFTRMWQWDSCPTKKILKKKKIIFQFSIKIRIKQSGLFENQNIGQK